MNDDKLRSLKFCNCASDLGISQCKYERALRNIVVDF